MPQDGTRLPFELVHTRADARPAHELLALGWIATQRSEATRRNYTGMLRRWFEWLELHQAGDPLQVGRMHVELYQRHLEAAGTKRSSIGTYLNAIASYYSFCVEEGVLEVNPVDRVKRPSQAERLSLDRTWLTRPQLHDLLEGAREISPTAHAMLCVLGLNGLRVAEACSLNIEHLEKQGPFLGVRFTRKGGKPGQAPFSVRTAEAINETTAGRTAGPIFLNREGRRMRRESVQRIIDRAVPNVRGHHGRITPHSLRHTAFTLAAQAGVPLDQIRVDGGWADLRTPGIYLHGRDNPAASSTHAITALMEGAA